MRTTMHKRSTKKQSAKKSTVKKTSEQKVTASVKPYASLTRPLESYVVPKEKSKLTSIIHRLNPLHPHSRNLAGKIKRDTDVAVLSAQAATSVYKDDLAERIPRAEVAEHMKFITEIAPTTTPAGSFRRGVPTSNDIDIVICEPIEHVLAQLNSIGYIKHTFSAGAHKFSGIVKLPTSDKHRHLDIVVTNPVSYPFTMLYFTGSRRHNIILRLKAKRIGLKLNEYGLFKNGVAMSGIASERDIFTALGIEYKEPSERV